MKNQKKFITEIRKFITLLMQLISLIHQWLKYSEKEFIIVFYVNI